MTKKIYKAYCTELPFVDVPPIAKVYPRAPTAADTEFSIGYPWVYKPTADTASLYQFGGIDSSGDAIWMLSTPGASDVDTINSLSPVLGNILIDGGTNITDVNAGHTVTLNLDDAITLATSVTSPLYTANAADAVVQAGGANDVVLRLGDNAGATFLRVQDSDDADLFTIDSDGALTTLTGLTVAGAAISLNDDSNFNTSINTGTSTGTITIGSANAGVITVDTSAGISLDGATASNFTVTGASEDLTLLSTGGSVNIEGTEADAAAISIQASDAAGGIDIDAGSAGIDMLATAGAISIEAQLSSNITVTGAGADLDIGSAGGSVDLTASEAAADAILIEASDGAGGVQVRAGSAGILIGNEADTAVIDVGDIAPTASRTITVGGGTVVTAAVTDTIDIGPDGATTNANSIKTVNVNTGGVTLGEVLTNIATGAITSGTHTVSIQSGNAAAGTVATNISTGTGTKSVNIGNADANTTMNLDGDVVINTNVNGSISACVGTSTGTVTLGNIANSGAMSLESSSTVDVDAAGAISLNSTAAAINIGNDDIDQAVNLGTDGERTVTVGSTNGAAGLVLQSGTGEITVTGTVKQIDAELMGQTGIYIPAYTQDSIAATAANTGGVPTGTTGDVNLITMQTGAVMQGFVVGAGQTILQPIMGANGLIISADQTATEGMEYNFPYFQYTVGTSDAFAFELGLYIDDMDGADPYVFGFRKTEANNALMSAYDTYAAIGMNAATSATNIVIADELNGGGQTLTNTTDAWGGDGSYHVLRVLVDGSGNVTYTIDGSAPTATHAFQFDNTDVVIPFIRIKHSASATDVAIRRMRIGYIA
ncbi:MAG: hypothetical protein R6U52_01575 [Kosmotogaceae bacterium]